MKRSILSLVFRPARFGAVAGSITLASLLALGFSAGPASAATPPVAPAAVPPALRPALYKALAKDAGPAYAIKKDGCATLPKSALKACFGAGGVRFAGAQHLALHLAAFGRGTKLAPVTAVQPVVVGNQVSYRHGNLTAWWRVLPMGFEQGFTIAKRPAGHGDLTLALAASRQNAGAPQIRHSREGGNPVRTSPLIPLRSEGGKELAWGKLRYGKLVVTDAKGKVIPATLTTQGSRILIAVNDAKATYPVTVDPLIWIVKKVTSNDGAAYDEFGFAVATDGPIAIIGAPEAGIGTKLKQGAAYVFSMGASGVWSQTAKLTASDGAMDDEFGHSVAIEGSTGTAFIGAPYAKVNGHVNQGAVYVFNDSNGTWTQTAKLTAADGGDGDSFGQSLAPASYTNGTAFVLIGAPFAYVNGHTGTIGQGAVYEFVNNNDGNGWTNLFKYYANDGAAGDAFGYSVAFGPLGADFLVGAPFTTINGNNLQGAAYFFTLISDPTPHYEQTKLVAMDGAANDTFGDAVATFQDSLTGDGGVGLYVGAPGAVINGNDAQGAVYFFVCNQTGTADCGQISKITASGGAAMDSFGISIAAAGATVLVGAPAYASGNPGRVFVFHNRGGDWDQVQTLAPISATAGYAFGESVAFSEFYEGKTALAGAPNDYADGHENQGTAYFLSPGHLSLTVSAPQSVAAGATYVAQTIVTNDGDDFSPHMVVIVPIPSAASFISASVGDEGSCQHTATAVNCDLYPINPDGDWNEADITFEATGSEGDVIHNSASISNATPALSASAPTAIGSPPPPLHITLEVQAPPHVKTGGKYSASITVTNPASVASPAVAVAFTLSPAAASVYGAIIEHNGHDRNCEQDSPGTWACVLNPIDANNTYAVIDVDARVTGKVGDVIHLTTSVVGAKPPVTASGATAIQANSPPVAQDSSVTTKENQALHGQLDASDADGDPLTFRIVTKPAHGTVKIDDASTGSYTYTPATGYVGKDSFTFKANDGTVDSNVATVSITIGSSNSPPVAKDAKYVTQENKPVSGTLEASDPDGDTLTFHVTRSPKHGHVSVDTQSGAFTYTPDKNFSGDDPFEFRANDGKADSNDATINISVNHPGQAGAGATGPWGLALLALIGLAALIRRRH